MKVLVTINRREGHFGLSELRFSQIISPVCFFITIFKPVIKG
jgi:hypothetical protein